MKKTLFLIVLIIILAAAGYILLSKPTVETEKTIAPSEETTQGEMMQIPEMDMGTETAPQEFDETKAMQVQEEIAQQESMMQGQMMPEKKTFNIDAQNYSFSVKEIKVKKGDTVKIAIKNIQGFHDWTIDEFNAKTAQISAGQSAEVEFVADKTGTFEYYCSVDNHRQQGMVGKLIVE